MFSANESCLNSYIQADFLTMALIGEISSAFPNTENPEKVNPDFCCHDSDRSRCHSTSTQNTGPPPATDGSQSSFAFEILGTSVHYKFINLFRQILITFEKIIWHEV